MAAGLASAQPPQRITPNFKDADITQVAEAVAAATGKNFIIDPRVRAQVTMLSSTAMTPPAFYEAFLSILQVYGFIAVPAGDVVKILPDANARQFPAVDLPDRVSATSDEIVTQVLDVHNVSAAQLVPMLRPMIAQYGHLAAPGAGPPGAQPSPLAQAEKNAMVWADPTNNALVITAPPKIMHAVMDIIDKLDIRRPQVLVEAIIAEVDVDKNAELGVNWAAFSKGSNVPAGAFVSPVGGTSIVDLAAAIQNPANASSALLQGTTIGIGRIAGTGLNFAATLRGLRGDPNR